MERNEELKEKGDKKTPLTENKKIDVFMEEKAGEREEFDDLARGKNHRLLLLLLIAMQMFE